MADELLHKATSTFADGADGAKLSQSHWEDGHVAADGADGDVIVKDSTLSSKAAWLKMHGAQRTRGAYLRTHPDADLAASRVMLVSCDEAIMDDGTRVTSGLAGLVANLASAGAGGLDTGSEGASIFYDVRLIRKASDGTLALIFHRAKDYFLDEDTSGGSSDADAALRRATAPTGTLLGQGFKVDTTGLCPFVDVRLTRFGGIVGNVWAHLYSDTAGNPNASLVTSDVLDAGLISTVAAGHWVRFIFRAPVSLTATTQYHLVLAGDYTASDTVLLGWRIDNTAPAYANGTLKGFDAGVWTDRVADAHFKVYITRNDTALTYPAGYDQQCLLHPGLFNDGSSNLVGFTALDRRVRLLPHSSSSISSTVPLLVDLSAIVPPVPIRLWLAGSNSTAGARHTASGVPDGYGMVVDSLSAGARQFVSPLTADVPQGFLGVLDLEYQAIYQLVSSSNGRIFPLGYDW